MKAQYLLEFFDHGNSLGKGEVDRSIRSGSTIKKPTKSTLSKNGRLRHGFERGANLSRTDSRYSPMGCNKTRNGLTKRERQEDWRALRHKDLIRAMKGRSVVYFIATACSRYVKIGSTCSLLKRFHNLQTASPFDLYVIGAYLVSEGPSEYHLQNQFREHNARGEWFFLVPEIKALVREISVGSFQTKDLRP